MAFRTHYDNLKVSRTATKEEIKKSYRRLCGKHHPDKHPEENREHQNKILMIINQSYAILSNDVERRKHDEWIAHKELCERNAKNAQEERKRSDEERRHQEWKDNFNKEQERKRREAEASAKREKERKEAEAKKEKDWREREYKEYRDARWAAEMAAQKRKADEAAAAAQKEEEDRQAHIRSEQRKREAEKEKKKDQLVTFGMVVILIIAAIYYFNTNKTSSGYYAPAEVPNVETEVRPPKLKISDLNLIRNTQTTKENLVIHDWYYDIHADQFDFDGSKKELQGSIKDYPICQQLVPNDKRKTEIVFHFLKGGKRKYMPLSLRYLCGL